MILALLVGAGLRRDELSRLKFSDIRMLPSGKGFRYVLHVQGKGKKNRGIPIQQLLGEKLLFLEDTIRSGLVARSLNRWDQMGESISGQGICDVVRKYGALIGMPNLDPHDLRRSFAMIALNSGVPITQISLLLGHSDLAVTQRYMNVKLDLESTASDFVHLA